jgi:hypothetical protein
MRQLRRQGDDQLELARWNASEVARERADLDILNVMYVVKQMILDGRDSEARAAVAAWRRSKGVQG